MDDVEGSELAKDVFAHFGLALYCAQCLEHEIVLSLIYVDLFQNKKREEKRRNEWLTLFDAFVEKNYAKTLGQLIATIQNQTDVPHNLESILKGALKRRNWLAHNYFRERAEQFVSKAGCRKMIEELSEAQKLFEDAEAMLDAAVKPLRMKFGFTDERLNHELQNYMKGVEHDL